jgi:hypothetical protein
MSGNLNSAATDVTKRIGYFDTENGVFFQLASSILSIVTRSKTSGSVVDTAVAQSSWNIDKLDGTGASGYTLDLSKQQIFVIDFQWLGSGRIRYGVSIGGAIVYCHEVNAANILTVPWSQTGFAPFRVEITNSGSTASSLFLTCCTAICENFYNPDGQLRTINNSTTTRTASTTLPLISLRKQSAYLSVPVKIIDLGVFASSADDLLVTVVLNGSLTGASWSDVSGYCQRDVSATSMTGGTVLYSSYVRGAAGASSTVIQEAFQDVVSTILGSDLTGASDILTLYVSSVSGSANVLGYINYKEIM